MNTELGNVLEKSQQEVLQAAINSLLDNSPLDKVVACAASAGLDGATVPVRIALLHLRFAEDIPQEDSFARFLWQQCFAYALPRRRRLEFQKKLSETDGDITAVAEIHERIRNIFIEFRKNCPQRASELGEVLAYCIAVSYLKAAQMAAKMSLKTSSNMPVHGLDGIHAVFENEALTVYYLESKLTKTANAGIKDYAKSVSSFLKNEKQYLREYEIVGDLGNLDALEGKERELALRHFDIINEPNLPRRERSVGVICYSEVDHFSNKLLVQDEPPQIHEKHFAEHYSKDLQKLSDAAFVSIKEKNGNPNKCVVFFVAVPDVARIRQKFYAQMGLPALAIDDLDSTSDGLGNETLEGEVEDD